MNFREFIKYLRFEVLDRDFNDLQVDFCDTEIRFKLYDMGDVIIVYNGDVDDIKVYMYEDREDVLKTHGIPFTEIKDVFEVMKAIKDNAVMLDRYINMVD